MRLSTFLAAVFLAALVAVSGTAHFSSPGIRDAADGICPGTMVWDGTSCK
jgi:hypothetical protein